MQPRKIGDATLEAERAMHENYDVLIAAGGDGTLNEVVNGIAEKPNRPEARCHSYGYC